MTISTSIGRELDVDVIVRRSYQLAGLIPAEQGTSGPNWAQRSALGRDLLETIVDEIQTEGVFARSVSMTTVALTSGTYTYTLPSTVFDCVENGSYIAASESDLTKATAETPVIQKDREAWQVLGSKAATGRPIMFWTDRSVFPIQVNLWPIPNEAGHIRFQTQRLLSDVEDSNVTVDLERYWVQYLLWELAHHLASAMSQPDAKCMRLQATAAQKRARAKAQSNQSVPSQIYLDHPTPAWRARH